MEKSLDDDDNDPILSHAVFYIYCHISTVSVIIFILSYFIGFHPNSNFMTFSPVPHFYFKNYSLSIQSFL